MTFSCERGFSCTGYGPFLMGAHGPRQISRGFVDGLEKTPASFLGVLQGKNFGKMLVRMAP